MSRFRFFLVPLSVAWLSVHLLVTAGAVIVAFVSEPSDIVCTCEHGADHGLCPMHRTPSNSTRCRLQGPQDSLAALISVLGPLVLPAASDAFSVDAPAPGLIGYASPLPSDWIVPPELPPPRS